MWRPLGCADSERFALVWETEELKALNNTLYSFVKNKVQPPHFIQTCFNGYCKFSFKFSCKQQLEGLPCLATQCLLLEMLLPEVVILHLCAGDNGGRPLME